MNLREFEASPIYVVSSKVAELGPVSKRDRETEERLTDPVMCPHSGADLLSI